METSLRKRILSAAPGIRVGEVVSVQTLRRLPPTVAHTFAAMTIEWLPNRVWGESFQLGDRVLRLGHRQGDHVAMQPGYHGIPGRVAERLLRLQVEGSALHELGHALLDAACARMNAVGLDAQQVLSAVQAVAQQPVRPSTYQGHSGRCKTLLDVAHEQFAEAFRWWAMHPTRFRREFPVWARLVDRVLATLAPGFLP